ncbi:GNAT family N-acetyltransferase [Chryseolinea lacunae]|uniref:GNAT family N-acetyltransferase n=1 Tax=Chryseolinea lacunae TaxID=2801331 RepID=A0ABS1KRX8_9BACT|nr:GNAT family N-acetyltransferase [Chryseolinea lacunae]MBL0741972.1 GNAT family N-acetyltransferase [Chryseolinea lacunae]
MKPSFTIIPYEDQHQPDFKALNLEWLDLHNLTEQRDLDVLNDPRKHILDEGGFIFLAVDNGKVIGSSAIMKEHKGVYELAKMAVAVDYRGQGLSKPLIEICIQKARELGAEKIELFSSTKLQTALKLYERYGFQHVPLQDSPFETADVKMVLKLE